MLPGWPEIADALLRALEAADRRLRDEHAVRGLDAMSEVALHAVLAEGLTAAGWGVHREVRFPGDRGEPASPSAEPGGRPRRNKRTDTDRDRCDLVLTPSAGDRLLDPVHAMRRIDDAAGTLFAPLAPDIEAEATAGEVRPEDAAWLELKAVAQHAYRDGVPVPNRAYGTELVAGPGADVAKLAADGVIERAAAVVVVFTETLEIAEHDLLTATHRMLDRDLPIAPPEVRSTPIDDRAGNAAATVAVFPVRGLGGSGF